MKKRTIIDIGIILILLIVLIILGNIDYKMDEKKDNKRFDKEYSMVSRDNVYKYADEDKVVEILEKGNGIIFMAFPENEWSNYYAKILNDSARKDGIKEIYYYNFLADRQKESVQYKRIIKYLEPYLKKDDMGRVNIYAPCLVVLKNGSVMSFDDETVLSNAKVNPKEYWNNENVKLKEEQFHTIFTIYLGGTLDGGEE